MLPKASLDKIKLRNKAFGNERRRNMTKVIMENMANFPKGVELDDIDKAFNEWVDKTFDITYDGRKLPTFKMFSNQRLNEYSQTWSHLDETGNLLLNFKLINRENNPRQGQLIGGDFNIPRK